MSISRGMVIWKIQTTFQPLKKWGQYIPTARKRAPRYTLKGIKQQKQTSKHPKLQSKKKDSTSVKENTSVLDQINVPNSPLPVSRTFILGSLLRAWPMACLDQWNVNRNECTSFNQRLWKALNVSICTLQ